MSVVVTGCIPCLRAIRPCNPTNPGCRRRAISSLWSNRSSEPQILSLHINTDRQGPAWDSFLRLFTRDSTITGFFESGFWSSSLPRACAHNEALFNLASAVGALYELTLRHGSGRLATQNAAFRKPLIDCNKAIELLRTSSDVEISSEVMLVACILFVFFESLQGNMKAALDHGLRGTQLLGAFAESAMLRGNPKFIEIDAIRSIVYASNIDEGMRLQALCVYEDDGRICMMDPTLADQPVYLMPLEDCSCPDSLASAIHHTTLELYRDGRKINDSAGFSVQQSHVLRRYNLFIPWLVAWKQSFDSLRCRARYENSPFYQEKLDILEANWRLAMILAKLDFTLGRIAWNAFTNEFRTIIRLCDSVSGFLGHVTNSMARYPFLTNGISASLPLFFAMSRCSDLEIRQQAADSLISRQREVCLPLGGDERYRCGREGSQTRSWTAGDWLDFMEKNSLDRSMSAFLGGFINSANVC